jgi:hypothetical protein
MIREDKCWMIQAGVSYGHPFLIPSTAEMTRQKCIGGYVYEPDPRKQIGWEKLKRDGYRCQRVKLIWEDGK